jgi:3-oxoacyl-[acyl-carrier-protein] synthase II
VMLGNNNWGARTIFRTVTQYNAEGPDSVSPFYITAITTSLGAGQVAIRLGVRGPNFTIGNACVSGLNGVGEAWRYIREGTCDAVLAGGTDALIDPTEIAGFSNSRAVSMRNDEPERASRPFDRDRDGFVLSDGGGAVLLEELEHAKRRGANIYAELIGFGMSGDAHHITAPPEDGEGARLAMANALRDASLDASAVQHINAHATSTPLGDKAETVAMKRAFGEHAKKLAVSSTKSMTGHLLGAAGVVEAIFSILAIRDNVAPPTINYVTPDPDCDLDYVPNSARRMPIDIALSNSFGFGGTNGSLIFKRFSA